MEPVSHVYDLTRLRRHPMLKSLQWQEEFASTNDVAAALAGRNAVPVPCLVLADRQSAGRGRGGNTWRSTAGSLTCSIIIDPAELTNDRSIWPRLSLLTGLAVATVTADGVPFGDVRVKWPNDIYLDDAKVAGILLEVPPGPESRLVVGIGLNVNTDVTAIRPEIDRPVTSMSTVSGQQHDMTAVVWQLLTALAESWSRLTDPTYPLAAAWNEHCLLSRRTVAVKTVDQVTMGMCLGIDETGALLIDTPERIVRCTAGTVVEVG